MGLGLKAWQQFIKSLKIKPNHLCTCQYVYFFFSFTLYLLCEAVYCYGQIPKIGLTEKRLNATSNRLFSILLRPVFGGFMDVTLFSISKQFIQHSELPIKGCVSLCGGNFHFSKVAKSLSLTKRPLSIHYLYSLGRLSDSYGYFQHWDLLIFSKKAPFLFLPISELYLFSLNSN